MGRFWFVRHAESTANAEGWLAGHTDAPLTSKGRAQAHALREVLAELQPRRCWASDLCRATETARIAWPSEVPPLERHPVLRERAAGDWEGIPRRQLRQRGAFARLLTWTGRPPGGESQRDLALRVLSGLDDLDGGNDTLCFVHGGLIRVVVGLLDGTPVDQIGGWKVPNTAVVPRDVPRGRWRALRESLS